MENGRIKTSYHRDFLKLLDRIEDKYGYEIFNLDGIGDQLDITKFNKKFFNNKSATADISVDGNSNVADKGIATYNNEAIKPQNRLNSYYMLWKQLRKLGKYQMANEAIEDAISGRIYINDFHGYGAGMSYCFNYSTMDILINGIGGLTPNLNVDPPKHLTSFISQLWQFIKIASTNTLGATGTADLLLTLSIYVEKMLEDCGESNIKFASQKDCWNWLAESIEKLIYTVNQPMKGTESPFTNVGVYDDYFLDKMLPNYVNPRTMKPVSKEIVKKVQDVFLQSMNNVMERTVITFPVVTACFSLNDDKEIQDTNFLDYISEMNSKFYFINMYGGKTSTLSSCCRLRSEQDKEYFNSLGAGGSKIGSLGVVTLNLPRIAYEYGKEGMQQFKSKIADLSAKAFYINHIRRQLIIERIEANKHPLYQNGFIEHTKQYSTLGFNGFNEAIEIMGCDPLAEEGIQLGKRILETMNHVNDTLGKWHKVPVNLEQTPSENSAVKLAKKDRYLGFNEDYVIYSNQFIPLTTNADMLDRIRLQGEYDAFCSGGSILHINDSADTTTNEYDAQLTAYIFKQGVVYYARNKNLQVCKNKHVQTGLGSKCKTCNEPIKSNYTRVVGFITQVDNWIKERRELDYPNREFYKMQNNDSGDDV